LPVKYIITGGYAGLFGFGLLGFLDFGFWMCADLMKPVDLSVRRLRDF